MNFSIPLQRRVLQNVLTGNLPLYAGKGQNTDVYPSP